MNDKVPAEVFPPGEFLKEELEARGWTQTDLAEILGRPPRVVNEIIAGKRAVTPETAQGLAAALGTSAELWLNLENSYRLWRLQKKGTQDPAVARRAFLYTKFPIKDLLRRKWIEPSDNIDVLEQRVREFYGIKTLEDTPQLAAAARKGTAYGESSMAEQAWYGRAKQLAKGVEAVPFSDTALRAGMERLRALRQNAEDVRLIPSVLATMGIRLVVIEHLPKTRIDGATLWLSRSAPVIALSLRFDRLDWFWFTLLHEIVHVQRRDAMDGPLIEADLVGEGETTLSRPAAEVEVDRAASTFLVPSEELDHFIARTRPFYANAKVRGFAARITVHPGLVVGQLHKRKELPYSHLRQLLVPIRNAVVDSALTDGWGRVPVVSW